ncbi:hypothetical protein IG631_08336 [Alternaria alternata]|nr:hypothetical protein IG631_08336 [Alternaria alternata]
MSGIDLKVLSACRSWIERRIRIYFSNHQRCVYDTQLWSYPLEPVSRNVGLRSFLTYFVLTFDRHAATECREIGRVGAAWIAVQLLFRPLRPLRPPHTHSRIHRLSNFPGSVYHCIASHPTVHTLVPCTPASETTVLGK